MLDVFATGKVWNNTLWGKQNLIFSQHQSHACRFVYWEVRLGCKIGMKRVGWNSKRILGRQLDNIKMCSVFLACGKWGEVLQASLHDWFGKQRLFTFWWFNFYADFEPFLPWVGLLQGVSAPANLLGQQELKARTEQLMMHPRYRAMWVWAASWLKEKSIDFAKKHPKNLSCLYSFTIMDTCRSWSWQVRVNYQAVAQNYWPQNWSLQYSVVLFKPTFLNVAITWVEKFCFQGALEKLQAALGDAASARDLSFAYAALDFYQKHAPLLQGRQCEIEGFVIVAVMVMIFDVSSVSCT